MLSPLVKVLLRPVARAIDALLEKLHAQITNGEKEEALRTVNELRLAFQKLGDYLK